MNEESAGSDLEKAFRESETIDSIDTPDPFGSHKIWDIVKVKDRANKPYILLGKEGEESKFWFQFHGESKEDMQKYVEWKFAADKINKDKKRTPDELDFLRRVCLAMGTLTELVDNSEFNEFMITTIIVETAKRWYKKDNPDKEPDDTDMTVYCELVHSHIQQLTSIITGVVGTMSDKDSTPTIVGD